MKRLTVILLFLCNILLATGQESTGVVLDKSTGKPIENALIRFFSSDKKLISYFYTEADGKFSLPDKSTVSSIDISCLSYKNIILTLEEFRSNPTIHLNESPFNMKDVVVTSNRIVEKKDTLVYSVAGFSMPQDRTIADVMRKMPGIDIKTDGRIEYNGIPINKFYIEGLDLLNNKYTLASNNLDKKNVKSVEVLRNHQPVTVLRDKTFSEQAAINLILEDNAKLNLTGTADIGIGYNKDRHLFLHDNRILGMIFRKNKQNLSIYKSNDIGKDISYEVIGVNLQEQNTSTLMENSFISGLSASSDLPYERYTFNQSHLAATNHLQKVSKNGTLRTQISYFYNDIKRYNEKETNYILSNDSNVYINESYRLKQNQNNLDASINYELNSDRIYLKNNFKTSLKWQSDRSNMYLNNRSVDLYDKPNQKYFIDDIALTVPISNEKIISFTSSTSYNDMPQELLTKNNSTELINYQSINSANEIAMSNNIFGLTWKNKLGFEYHRQTLSAKFENISLGNKEYLNRSIPSFETSLSLKRGSVIFNADIKIKWWNIKGTVGSKSSLLPELNMYFKYDLNSKSSISYQYNFGQSTYNLRQLYGMNIYTSYRSITTNELSLKINPTHINTIHYEYLHPIKGLSYMGTIQSVISKNKSLAQSSFNKDEIYIISHIPADFYRYSTNISSRISKSFSWWKSLFAISGNYAYTENKRLNKNAITNYYQNALFGTFSVSMRPASWLSLDLDISGIKNKLTGKGIDTKTSNINYNFDIHYIVTKEVTMSWKNNYIRYPDLNNNVFFSDLSLFYEHKRMEYELCVNNIFNKKAYCQNFISPDYSVISKFNIRPREFIFKISFRF